jgi:hypothetical protein
MQLQRTRLGRDRSLRFVGLLRLFHLLLAAMGESCAELCSGSALFVFNGVDIVFGVALTVYSLYLGASAPASDGLTRC